MNKEPDILEGRRKEGRLDSLFCSPSVSGSNNQLLSSRTDATARFTAASSRHQNSHQRSPEKARWWCEAGVGGILGLLQFPPGREGGRERRQHVLISANKGVLWPFSLCFVSKRPWRSEVLAFPRLLSRGWQKGPVWNPSRQVEEWRQHRVSRSVFTFCLFAEWRHGHLFLSPSSLHLPTSLSFFFINSSS